MTPESTAFRSDDTAIIEFNANSGHENCLRTEYTTILRRSADLVLRKGLCCEDWRWQRMGRFQGNLRGSAQC